MAKRKIIKINEEKCNGCGLCIPNCPEGALQIIDGKARLISDLFCDGLGACIGHCPEGAITVEEREAEGYDEKKVMANIVRQGENVTKAHLEHLKEHGQQEYLKEAVDYLEEKGIGLPDGLRYPHGMHVHTGGCPGSRMADFRRDRPKTPPAGVDPNRRAGKDPAFANATADRQRPRLPIEAHIGGQAKTNLRSQLGQWPVQIMLVPPHAPYFKDADLLIAADCVPFAYASFHEDLLKGKILLVGCPKLDDLEFYKGKITQIVKNNGIKSVTYAHMEVPCCFGLVGIIESAISDSGKKIPFIETVISIKGDRLK
jgi:ferredoxin